MFSLIVPVYKNEANIPALLVALEALNSNITGSFEVVFVIDGSPDRCYEILRDTLPKHHFQSQLILLSKNFGAFAAIRAGLEAAKGNFFGVMAADLQEPPELILQMEQTLLKKQVDVVVAARSARSDPLMSQLSSKLFWKFYKKFIVPEMPEGGIDIFACNRAFRDQLLCLKEGQSSLIAQIFWLGFRREIIYYERLERQSGTSAWTLSKKINYMLDSIFAFTDLPIKILISLGGVTTLLASVFGVIIVLSRILGIIVVPGYVMTILTIMFFGFLNILGLGIIGSYSWRAYENTKARPLNIILSQHAFDKNRKSSE